MKQYADWFRYYHPQQATEEDNADKAAEQEAGDGSKPRNGIRARWEKYRKEFTAQQVCSYVLVKMDRRLPRPVLFRQLQRMFDYHRKSPWFAEKYDPAPQFVKLRARVRKIGWRGKIDAFLLDLDSGKFDPDPQDLEPNSPPSSPVKDAATNGASLDTGNGVTEPSEDVKPVIGGDDDMQFNVEQEDDNNEQDGQRGGLGRSSDGRRKIQDEIAVEPDGNQVMIRTIPPDIGRVKLENVSYAGVSRSIVLTVVVRRALAFRGTLTSHWVIPCRRGTTTVRGGFVSAMMPT